LLHDRLPGAAIVSIGHRSTLAEFHKRGLVFVRDGERFRVREATLNAVAS
jgi:putative ATP-binding cassette transporter